MPDYGRYGTVALLRISRWLNGHGPRVESYVVNQWLTNRPSPSSPPLAAYPHAALCSCM